MHNENKLLSGQIKYRSTETTEKQTDFIVSKNITVIFQTNNKKIKTGKELTHKLSAGNSKIFHNHAHYEFAKKREIC